MYDGCIILPLCFLICMYACMYPVSMFCYLCVFVMCMYACMYPVCMFCYLCVFMLCLCMCVYVYILSLFCYLCVCMMCVCMYEGIYVWWCIVEIGRQPQLLVLTFHLVWDTKFACQPDSRYFSVSVTHHHIWTLGIETYTTTLNFYTCSRDSHSDHHVYAASPLPTELATQSPVSISCHQKSINHNQKQGVRE